MNTKLLAAFVICGFIAANSAMAANQNNNSADSAAAKNLGQSKKTVANFSAAQLEILKKEQARLQALIEKLQKQLGMYGNATSTASEADLKCVRDAVEVRENSVASAYGTMTSCVNTELGKRKTSLIAAWKIALTRDRNTAVNKAWTDFQKARKVCNTAYKTAVKSAWETFKNTTKTCKANGQENGKEGLDLSLEL